MLKNELIVLFTLLLLLSSCGKNDLPSDPMVAMQLTALRVGTKNILKADVDDVGFDEPIVASFNVPLNKATVASSLSLRIVSGEEIEVSVSYLDANKTLSILPAQNLEQNTTYQVEITSEIRGENGETFSGIVKEFTTINPPLRVNQVQLENEVINTNQRILNIDKSPLIFVKFSEKITPEPFAGKVFLHSETGSAFPTTSQAGDSSLLFQFSDLTSYQKYTFYLPTSVQINDKSLEAYSFSFYTALDSTFKFPEITDDELLTKIQEQTFKYFWDFGHPVSGLARERNTSGETVTSGGSGFGVMSIIVGIERGFITRQEGVDRLEKIVDFLGAADRFHGAWSHWLNGTNGNVIPFSSNDNGGDLVETAFMIQGLITVRQYLNGAVTQEADLIDKINDLWEEVEWDWYTQGGQNVLYWHWSPNFEWEKNHKITGWNEALIIYVLASASPTHTIDADVYTEGWSRNGDMMNSNNSSYYGYTLDLRSDRGGPLFFSHYSFLGLDPRNLEDQFANYWDQNVNHSLINNAYCELNPKNYVGYGSTSWGLTASDGNSGYSAHSPDNDRGVITPTAAISSLPYTPDKSMAAIKHFYYLMGDKLWGEYGFYDAFNPTEGWVASSYLAIDQGPIICMIENHRTGLLWNLFMSAPEVQTGLNKLGFTY